MAAAAAAMSAQLPPHATPQGNHSHHHHHQQQHHHHHHSQQQQQLHHHHHQQQQLQQQQQQQSSLSQGPHLHRSAERALEDAFFSAALNLSGRKLKEFPRSSVIDFDLSDTTQADLSKNRLNEVPLEVCHFVSLESLVLYHNCIRSIPEAIVNLRSLTYLNISRNQLTTLPPYLCKLPLQVLNASNNKLVSLPEELGQLKELSALDVSCNEIQALPPQIASLTCLRDLNVRRNNLVILPDEIADLPLVQLDVSCNRLGEIPVSFRKLKQLQSLVLDNNPMKSPPAQICIKGKHHIFKYLHMEACKLDKKLADRLIRPAGSSTCLPEDFVPHKACGLLDSGFNSVDSGNKRWSGNEARSNRIKQPSDEESASTALMRGADSSRDQRLRRETPHTPLSNGLVVEEGQEVDYIEDEDEEDAVTPKAEDQPGLTTKFMAYIERRISHEKLFPLRTDETPLPRSEDEGGWRDEQSRTPTADDEQGGGGRAGADREAGDGALRERHRSADGSQERRRPVVYSASFCETDIRRRPISFHDARRLPQSSSFTAKDRRRPPAFVHSAPSGGHGGGGGGGEGGGPCAPLAGILRNAGSTSASPLPGLVSNGQPGVTAMDTTVYQQEDLPPAEFEFQKKREQILLERTRHEAQLARRRYEDERQRLTKHSTTQTFTAAKPRGVHQHSAESDPQSDCVNVPPSRKPHHIDDSALLVSPADPVSSPDAALPKATPQPHKFTKSEEKTPTNAYSGSNAPLFGLKLRSESASVRPCSQPPHSRPSPSPAARSPPPPPSPLSSPTHPTTPSPSSPTAAAAPPTTATASHAHTHSPHSPHRAAASVPASKPPGSFLFSPAGGGLLEQRLAFNSPSSAMDSFEGLDPSFTVKRKLSHVREEMELIEQLKKNIECRLKVTLPGDPVNLGSALMDGVVLCHLANHIRPRSVPSIHVPSPAVPKLTMAKCRRNVENFLEACKKMGVPQEQLCLPHHILEEKGLSKVSLTVQCLLDLATSKPSQASVV